MGKLKEQIKNFIIELCRRAKNRIIENFDKYYDMGLSSLKYIFCMIFIIIASKNLLKYPLKLAQEYGIKLSGTEYVELYKNYTTILLGVLTIGLLAIPIVKLVNKLKKLSKEGADFYGETQNTYNDLNKFEVQEEAVKDLINSNDDNPCDEKTESDMYDIMIQSENESYNMLKCKNIKNNMKPLTVLVTRELYNNNKTNITKDTVVEYIKNAGNRRKKKLEEKNKNIAKNIIVFLKNNDIIESDDIEEDKYYFTIFGNIFMNYFQNGII